MLAIVVMTITAIEFSSSDRPGWAFLYGPAAFTFLPVVIASIVETPIRPTVLKASTVLALIVGLGSAPIDYGVPILMAPATVVLAQAAGLIFQGKRSST